MQIKVNQGDTLSKVLQKNGIEPTAKNIKKVAKDNHLENPDKIQAGQKLKLPEDLMAEKNIDTFFRDAILNNPEMYTKRLHPSIKSKKTKPAETKIDPELESKAKELREKIEALGVKKPEPLNLQKFSKLEHFYIKDLYQIQSHYSGIYDLILKENTRKAGMSDSQIEKEAETESKKETEWYFEKDQTTINLKEHKESEIKKKLEAWQLGNRENALSLLDTPVSKKNYENAVKLFESSNDIDSLTKDAKKIYESTYGHLSKKDRNGDGTLTRQEFFDSVKEQKISEKTKARAEAQKLIKEGRPFDPYITNPLLPDFDQIKKDLGTN